MMHGRAAELRTTLGSIPGATSGTLLSAVKWPVAAAEIAKRLDIEVDQHNKLTY